MGENPPYGVNRGDGGNAGKTWGPFGTMLGRADTQEAIVSKPVAPLLHSTSISFQDTLLSAMRYGFGGHLERSAK
jgi:hypothetical protein